MLHQEKSCYPGVKHRLLKQQQTVFARTQSGKFLTQISDQFFAACVNDSLVVNIVYDFCTRWAGSQINK
jgi:uncharacterized membrane protein